LPHFARCDDVFIGAGNEKTPAFCQKRDKKRQIDPKTGQNDPQIGALTTIRFLSLNIFPSAFDPFMVSFGPVCAAGNPVGACEIENIQIK
jgi:hypothetical protein